MGSVLPFLGCVCNGYLYVGRVSVRTTPQESAGTLWQNKRAKSASAATPWPFSLLPILVALCSLISGCVQNRGASRASESGFVPLLSTKALPKWRQCGPGQFVVTNGIATGEGGMGLWWFSGQPFTNFVLRGEFIQEQEIADSGVFVRFPDPGNDPWVAVHKGHEMEIGDPAPKDPTWRTGSIYPFAASEKANTKPVGQWNSYEIVCTGQNYTVRINGEVVTRWTDPKQRTDHGYVGLQNYNDGKTVRHRGIELKALP